MVSALEFVASGSPLNLLSLCSIRVIRVNRSVGSRQFWGRCDGKIDGQVRVRWHVGWRGLGLESDSNIGGPMSRIKVQELGWFARNIMLMCGPSSCEWT
jgi:hypothetical protein